MGEVVDRERPQGRLEPTSDDPHVEHTPSGLRFPIHWVNGCPHIRTSQQRELEMASALDVLPDPELIPVCAVKVVADHLKTLENMSPGFAELVTRKVTAYELAQHRASGHKRFMPECPECRLGAIRRRAHRRQPESARPGGELSVDLS